jgi:flagellar hook-length control protein FliK
VRSEQAPGPEDKNPGAVEQEQQGDAAVQGDSGNLQATAAAAAEESAAKTTGGDGKQASSDAPAAGRSPGDGTAARAAAQSAGGSEKAAPPEPVTEQGDTQSAGAEGAAGAKKSQVASSGKAAGEKQAKTAAKPSAVPPAAESAEDNRPATQAKATVVASGKSAAAGDAVTQAPPQAPPAAVSRETVASSASAEGKMAAALEESSAGRVARVGTDTQSGQTGLFQGQHGPTGSIQGGSGAGSADAPAQPFAHDLMQQVTEKAVFHLRNGRAEARIDLKPESLGHLRLHVSTDNGQVTLKIMTESPWVRDMIESNISHLRTELQHHNLQIDRLDVSVSGGGQNATGDNAQTAGSARLPADSAGTGEGGPAVPADEEDARHPSAQRMGVGLVDYFA